MTGFKLKTFGLEPTALPTEPHPLILLKMGHPRHLFRLFLSFQTNITIFTANKYEKCPSCIQYRDSNLCNISLLP